MLAGMESSEFSQRYRAVAARDRRFDGQFVMGVRTTGIYCRPSCPARTPKPGNVEFLPTSAAAHLAGYRACRRCLPEAVPGSPWWNVRQDVAARAMRLIADGVVDRDGVEGLARRLGYSSRQLARVLVAELGAGPLALARAQRAQNARHLLTATDLPASDVAFAAGFSSIRQFTDTIAEVFGLTPTQVRATGRRAARAARIVRTASAVRAPASPGGGHVTVRLRLPYRRPLDLAGLLGWFAERALTGVEAVTPQSYARVLHLPHGPGAVEVRSAGPAVGDQGSAARLDATMVLADLADLAPAIARTRRLLDLDADPVAVDVALSSHRLLAPAVRATPGIRIPGLPDPTEAVTRAICGQQVGVSAARAQVQALVAAAGQDAGLPADCPVTTAFPGPEAVARVAPEVIRGPVARTQTLVRVCQALADGDLALGIEEQPAEASARLREFPGIGVWTADYVVLRLLGAPDILMSHDVAARRGARALGLPGTARVLEREGSALAPWRSYLSEHLWAAAGPPRPGLPGLSQEGHDQP